MDWSWGRKSKQTGFLKMVSVTTYLVMITLYNMQCVKLGLHSPELLYIQGALTWNFVKFLNMISYSWIVAKTCYSRSIKPGTVLRANSPLKYSLASAAPSIKLHLIRRFDKHCKLEVSILTFFLCHRQLSLWLH